MTCSCKCHTDGMNQCMNCEIEHERQKSAGYLIDQKLQAFFVDKDETGAVKNLIFAFDKANFTISWDNEKNTFKFTVQPR